MIPPVVLCTLALALAVPVPAAAQTSRLPAIALIQQQTSGCPVSAREQAFLDALRELGLVPGQTIHVERLCHTGTDDLRVAVRRAVGRPADVIVAAAPLQASAARSATTTIPIVCASCGDPIANGMTTSLARPSGNVTGLASLSAELIGKRVALAKELLPGVARVTVLVFPANPGTPPTLAALTEAGQATGLRLQLVEIRAARDFDSAIRTAAAAGTPVLIQDDPLSLASRADIAAAGLRHRVPIMAGVPELTEAGALMSYGPNRNEMYRRAAFFTQRILKGARVADLPFEQASKLDLVLNLKTARSLHLAIQAPVMLRADRLIE